MSRDLTRWIARLSIVAVCAICFPALVHAQPAPPPPGDVPKEPATTQPGSPTPEAQKAPPGFWERDTLTGDWGGIRTSLEDAGVKFGLEEQSEFWGNAVGGKTTGVVYNGLTTGSLAVDLDKLVGWTGAKFFVNAYQIHFWGPSLTLTGNLQDVSSIEAIPSTKLYDLWIEQALFDGRLSIRVGQEGASDELMLSQYAAVFMNSSFGYPALASVDLPSTGPNFPLATPFVRVLFKATDQFTMIGALYNSDPAPQGSGQPQVLDGSGTAFRVNGGALAFGEFWYSINQDDNATGLPGTYKIGAWYSTARFNDQVEDINGVSLANPASVGIPLSHSPGYAVYGLFDQMVWRSPGTKDQGIGVFAQVMGAPSSFNLSNVFAEAGLNWKGPIEGRENDVAGLGFAYLGISPSARKFANDVIRFTGLGSPYATNESIIEATYLYQATPWLSFQPDLQYVINPGAYIPSRSSLKPLNNAVIGGVRATVQF